MTIYGADVSKYNPDPDWSRYAFMFARASIGLASDSTYAGHIAKATAAGCIPGAYHYLEMSNGAAQAALFGMRIGDPAGLLCAVDVEQSGLTYGTVADFQAWWSGHWPDHPLFVYTGISFGKRIFKGHPLGGPLWLAYYPGGGYPGDTDPTWNVSIGGQKPTIWQYGPAAPKLDGDAYRGTTDQLRGYTGASGNLPNVPGVDVGPKFTPDVPRIGVATVSSSNANVIRTSDGGFTPKPIGTHLDVYGTTTLTDGTYKGQAAWLVFADGDEAGLLLKGLSTFAADPPAGFTQADVDNARAAGAEQQWDSDKAALAVNAPK